LKRLGGDKKVRKLIGGPWAVRYSLSHLVKDETELSPEGWRDTARMLSHGSLAAGFLTGNFNACSVSSAASTGIMDLRNNSWKREMLDALAKAEHRDLAWQQLPKIMLDSSEPVGSLTRELAAAAGLDPQQRPLIFPTSDDQQAGLVGGGAVDSGQMAIILGSSAVVNSSSSQQPKTDALDVMRLNWGPYLWMRCYTNGAQFLDKVVGRKPKWEKLEPAARDVPPGCDGVMVLPFVYSEPSLGVKKKRFRWLPRLPKEPGVKARAALEALAYLIALGVKQHEKGGQRISRITVSGGIANNNLMCEILATVLDQPLYRLRSNEGPALGAAVTALAALENHRRRQQGDSSEYTMSDAVSQMVKFRDEPVEANPEWKSAYQKGLRLFSKSIVAG
jgi:sugar (pentulose or hexulose) kinase